MEEGGRARDEARAALTKRLAAAKADLRDELIAQEDFDRVKAEVQAAGRQLNGLLPAATAPVEALAALQSPPDRSSLDAGNSAVAGSKTDADTKGSAARAARCGADIIDKVAARVGVPAAPKATPAPGGSQSLAAFGFKAFETKKTVRAVSRWGPR